MANMTNTMENRMIDGIMRGGCLTTAGAAGSTAVVKGIWTATTAYSLGDIVVPHANMTGAGGKLLLCTTAGTSGSTNTLAVPNPGSTLADNTVTWTAIATIPAYTTMYLGLFTTTPSDTGGGVEVSGGSYARMALSSTLAFWAQTSTPGGTGSSSGTDGTTSLNATLTFPTATANWGTITGIGIFDLATSGTMLFWGALNANQVVNNGNTFSIVNGASGLTIQIDN